MSKLQELREFVKQQFEQADPSDKNAIDTLAKINNSLEDVETEIKEADENGYPEIANGLKEDMEVELENLKDQYEEQRRVETDKIRAKYQKRGSYARL